MFIADTYASFVIKPTWTLSSPSIELYYFLQSSFTVGGKKNIGSVQNSKVDILCFLRLSCLFSTEVLLAVAI